MVKYLNYAGVESLCKHGETEEINEYISFYEEKLTEIVEDKQQVFEVMKILGIDKNVEPIKKFIGNEAILPRTLNKLCHKLEVENDDRLQYEEYYNLCNTELWYQYIIDKLNESLGQ